MLIEPDGQVLRQMLEALGRTCGTAPPLAADGWTSPDGAPPCVRLASRLRHLHEVDLDELDLVVCGLDLQDGTGLDALAYVRGLRPALPVILTGDGADPGFVVEAIRAGAADFLVVSPTDIAALPLAVEKSIEHQRIRQENERLQREIGRSLAERELKHQQLQMLIRQLETMARTDELTGLYNRRWLNLTLEGAWAEASRAGLPLAFLMMDLDGFKPINDRLGHQEGDLLLKTTARVIQANSRQVDVAARYGGDEFCVLMPHTEVHEAARVAQRLLREFSLAVGTADGKSPIGVSIGVAHSHISRPLNAQQLIRHADEAMYAAKALRHSCIMVREAAGICDVDVLLSAAQAA
jgi:diguanylate cyclase (GGDEF)-like protein